MPFTAQPPRVAPTYRELTFTPLDVSQAWVKGKIYYTSPRDVAAGAFFRTFMPFTTL